MEGRKEERRKKKERERRKKGKKDIRGKTRYFDIFKIT